MVEQGVSCQCPSSHDKDNLNELKEEETSQDERASLDVTVWRKLDRWVLPLCAIIVMLAVLDRANIGNARVAGLQASLAMSNKQFAMILTVAYIPYIVSEFPSTLFLKYIGPDFMLPALLTLYGAVTASQGFVTNFSGLLACRLLLGLVGGGLFPGVVLYLSSFYPRKRLQTRVATFYASASLAGTFSGLLAAAIGQLHGKGGRPGWAWIFILEGAFTSVIGAISFFVLPRSPEMARFLTEKERTYVVSTLRLVGSVSEDDDKDRFSWIEIARTAKSPHAWFVVVIAFFSGTMTVGLAVFEPTIVASLGYSGSKAQLMSVPPFATTFAMCFISAIISDRYQCRGYTMIFFSLLKVIGFTMFYASPSKHVRYTSLFFSVTGSFCLVPTMLTWLANNSAPHVRRATAVAVVFIAGELGGILSIWLLGSLSPPPHYTTATMTFIVMSISTVILSSANLVYLWWQNRLKAERRLKIRKEEEPESLGDRSAWFVYSL